MPTTPAATTATRRTAARRHTLPAAALGLAMAVTALLPLSAASAATPNLPGGPGEIAPVPVVEPVPVTGEAWPGVEAEVDEMFQDYVTEFNLPGASISASKDGRLVISKAYGHANTDDGEFLDPDDQILLGSVTKALVTGPSVDLAMEQAGLPLDTPLYGAGGVHGTTYDADIAIGAAATGTPIEWYEAITVQHVLDHAAGFGGASISGTKALFGVTDDELTYHLVHRHFLQTQGLLYEPGTSADYSNHHFGSMKLLIEELTGMDADEFVASAHLARWGLEDEIEPRSVPNRPTTADVHEYIDDEPSPYYPDFSDDLGSLAGAYRSSSRDAVELMVRLAETYSPDELDHLGFARSTSMVGKEWGDDSTAFLSHNGIIGGARDYVFMTVDGITMSMQINIGNGDARVAMVGLFHDIADLLRGEDIPTHYDIWTGCTLPAMASGYAQVARHGTPAADYQCLFDQLTGAGYELEWLDASTVGGSAFFNTVFVPSDGDAWRAFHGLDGAAYQELFDEQVAKGMAPAQVDSYPSAGGTRYAGFFGPATEPFVAYHGLTKAQQQDRFDELVADGYSPTSLSVVPTRGGLRWTGVYEQGVPGSFLVTSTLTPAGYQALFDQQVRIGRSPVFLNGYNDEQGDPRLVAVFRSQPTGPFLARHGLTSAGYQAEWDQATAGGHLTTVVTAYADDDRARYAAVWRK